MTRGRTPVRVRLQRNRKRITKMADASVKVIALATVMGHEPIATP